ncbi:putative Rab-GTPase-TBC domain-containing protein [Helianthus annuus]|uniref:Putative ypt/Rab-GAP domain of gyp1p superfamily protein n=1 Tax=Helianthus annuus TaxID=4232 RepID=A0A251UEV5_HELAN|nr:GTPase-activating protein gyp7 isoform X1 [Helianthus annuus]KAF5800541.1 putative Rab-GTPase-TBC domain-containing protein [Helianthus annuus]KAJ0772258.1 putative Rab-GTPase-TBC domain-containing protein [Helianthus annuus]KAJ0906530.1 putative Rab-GTPase-TBC domain-containing protein [Helianthus annuus]
MVEEATIIVSKLGGGGSSNAGVVNLAITALLVVAAAAVMYSTTRGRLKSPWSRRKRKHALTPQQWKSFFTPDGKLRDGVKFLKKVRSGGVDASIRSEVWPFLLGVYELNSCKEERDKLRTQGRKNYEKLRRQCRKLLRCNTGESISNGDSDAFIQGMDSAESEDVVSARESLSSEEINSSPVCSDNPIVLEDIGGSTRFIDPNISDSDSTGSDSSQDAEVSQTFPSSSDIKEENEESSEVQSKLRLTEDFSTWQRIIRLDAIRANGDWIPYSKTQADVSEERALRSAEAVGLKDYEHLEACRIFHASRLVAILEAYALHDPEIGYCQGMSDLLSPIIAVMTEDHEAFWCFVGFMRKARHNFRLDETGIRRQLSRVSKIIKSKDSHLYKHLEKVQAEDCFFVYRMVVVLFRRELSFEQTICLWEVMWADQAAIRAGIGKSGWNKIRQRAPPTEDLLLYAIAASVLQRRKQIIEKYSSMDEIVRECNNMAGQLDVWKLLDDAHDLVVSVHDKIE